MRVTVIFILLTVGIATLSIVSVTDARLPQWAVIAIAVALLGLIALLYQGIIKPRRAVETGINLLLSQDFSSRLTLTGQHDADRIATLFNSMVERLKTERLNLQERNYLLNLLIETSPIGILLLDYDRKVAVYNSAFLTITGIEKSLKIDGQALAELPGEIMETASSMHPGENKVLRTGGNKIYRISSMSFMESGFKREFFTIEPMTDEIVKAEKSAYEKVIRIVSHEVNNTIGGITTLLSTLGDIHEDEPEIKEAIDSCITRAVNVNRFITSYADIAKIPSPRLAKVDLNRLVGSGLPFLEGITSGKDVELDISLSENPVTVQADAVMLEQALVNIVKNAAESAINGGRKITISVSSCPTGITVSDNGPGIDEETRGNLFTPFFTNKPGGHGLGLMIVSEILRRHGCDFSLGTDEDGITRFKIIFK